MPLYQLIFLCAGGLCFVSSPAWGGGPPDAPTVSEEGAGVATTEDHEGQMPENAGEGKGAGGDNPNHFKGEVFTLQTPSMAVARSHVMPHLNEYKNNVYGAFFNGPLLKDKLFYMLALDSQRKNTPLYGGYNKDNYTDLGLGLDWDPNERNSFQWRLANSSFHGGDCVPFEGGEEKGSAQSMHLQWTYYLAPQWASEAKIRRLTEDRDYDSPAQAGPAFRNVGDYRLRLTQLGETLVYTGNRYMWKWGAESLWAKGENRDKTVPKASGPGSKEDTTTHIGAWQVGIFTQGEIRLGETLRLGAGVRWNHQQGSWEATNAPFFRRHAQVWTYFLTGDWRPDLDQGRSKLRAEAGRYLTLFPPEKGPVPRIEPFEYSRYLIIPVADRWSLLWERTQGDCNTVVSYERSKTPLLDSMLFPGGVSKSRNYLLSLNYVPKVTPWGVRLSYDNFFSRDRGCHWSMDGSGVVSFTETNLHKGFHGSLLFNDRNWTKVELTLSVHHMVDKKKTEEAFTPNSGLHPRSPRFLAGGPSASGEPKTGDDMPSCHPSSSVTWDIGAKREFDLGKKAKLSTSLEVLNVLNSQSPFVANNKKNNSGGGGGGGGKNKNKATGGGNGEPRRLQVGFKLIF